MRHKREAYNTIQARTPVSYFVQKRMEKMLLLCDSDVDMYNRYHVRALLALNNPKYAK